jgi:hypothetical protein
MVCIWARSKSIRLVDGVQILKFAISFFKIKFDITPILKFPRLKQ